MHHVHNHLLRCALLSAFHNCWSWGSEGRSNLPEVTQLVEDYRFKVRLCSFIRPPIKMMLFQIKTFVFHHYVKENTVFGNLGQEDWQFSLQDALLWYHCNWPFSDASPHSGGMMEMTRWLAFYYFLLLTFLHSIFPKRLWSTGKENT